MQQSAAKASANDASALAISNAFTSVALKVPRVKRQDAVLRGILNNAQRGIASVQIHSVTDAMRLNVELALEQANILC